MYIAGATINNGTNPNLNKLWKKYKNKLFTVRDKPQVCGRNTTIEPCRNCWL